VPSVRTRSNPHATRVVCRLGTDSVRHAESPPAVSTFCYYVDARGRQHFNFIQRIWLQPQVEMAMTAVVTLALETLAVNLMTEVTRERNYSVAVGVTSAGVMQLARRFCEECLLTARRDGWKIPRATIRSWVAARQRASRT
jgi:hypothetical protein